jgi:hypothetical protein
MANLAVLTGMLASLSGGVDVLGTWWVVVKRWGDAGG